MPIDSVLPYLFYPAGDFIVFKYQAIAVLLSARKRGKVA
jgi:hypothetical protein